MATRINFVIRYRSAVNDFLSAFEKLNAISTEHTIMNETFVDGDISEADITAQQFTDGVASAKAIWTAFIGDTSAHNLYTLKR